MALSNLDNNTVTIAMVYGWCGQHGFQTEATISLLNLEFLILTGGPKQVKSWTESPISFSITTNRSC
jgi:hypothetical protein